MFSNYYSIFLSVMVKSLVLFIFLLLTVAFFTVLVRSQSNPADNRSSESESSDNSSGNGDSGENGDSNDKAQKSALVAALEFCERNRGVVLISYFILLSSFTYVICEWYSS
jgi:hypothetical protein